MRSLNVPNTADLLNGWRAARLSALQGGAFVRAMAGETLRRPLRRALGPQHEGSMRVDGLHASIEILRDRSGVPHVFAQNADDALFGLGFVQAQDRFWQMDFYRRVAAGRMAEVSGPKALPTDRLMRHIGLERAARAAWAATDSGVQARLRPYIDGVNAGMAATPLPLEIRILDYEPEPWRPEDSILWAKLVAFMLAPAWEAQVLRARMVEAVGLDAVVAIDPGYPRDGPVIAPPGAPYGALADEVIEAYAEVARATGRGGRGYGSNNWAVDGAHTENGHALLACDPHLTAVNPPICYFAHLDCPEFSVAGASLAGFPGMVWGFNRRIAWGPTAGLASTQDVFVEEFDASGKRYRTPTGWEEAEVIEERVKVRGHDDEVLQIRVTRHGPIVTPEIPGVRQALALASSVLDSEHAGEGILDLMRAGGIDEFRAATAKFHDFNLSFGYADVEGHVGMQVSGAIPIRPPGGGWLPAPGWDAAHDWQGYVAADAMPHEFDPPGGRVWSANNAPHAAGAMPFAGEFLDAFRATRIGEGLAASMPHSQAAAQTLQADRLSIPMRKLAEHLARIEVSGAEERALLERVRGWDGVMEPGSVSAAIVGTTYCRLLDAVLRAKLGRAVGIYLGDAHVVPNYNVIGARAGSLVMGLLDKAPRDWFGAVEESVDGRAVWTAALTRAFRDAQALLRERLGKDADRWTWGRCRRLTLMHGLAEVPTLARLFNVGPMAFGGDGNTIVQGGPLTTDPFGPISAIPALRLTVEMTEPPRAQFVLAGGQVGVRGHAHASDLLEDWLGGKLRPLRTERSAIEADGVRRLRLERGG